EQGSSCDGFRNPAAHTGGAHLPHLPGAPDRTPEPGLWPQLLQSLHHCKQQGACDRPRREPLLSCRVTYQSGDLRPHQFVATIVERLREVKLNPEEGQKRDLCVRHGEKLQLFCKEDEKVICWLCERSQEHRGHHTFLIEDVAQEYQDVNGIMERSKTLTVMKPNTLSHESSRRVLKPPDLSRFLKVLNELKDD
uniref:RING-type E3 ubiquitin transferase n=1 Tax=Rhinolophus ferrumequinum TaxID=59479 RepID=A0A671EWD2_RHIFE